jgi:hypothetical protein
VLLFARLFHLCTDTVETRCAARISCHCARSDDDECIVGFGSLDEVNQCQLQSQLMPSIPFNGPCLRIHHLTEQIVDFVDTRNATVVEVECALLKWTFMLKR